MKTIPNVYLIGDLHGSWKPVRDFYQRNPQIAKAAAANEQNILILLGDAGLNFFFNHRDEQFKEKLGKYPFTYFVIRGNHEERPTNCALNNPEAWDIDKFFGGTVLVEKQYPYIKYAMDYVNMYYIPYDIDYLDPDNPEDDDIEITKYYKTLVIPGAYSVDKYKRLQMGWSWFKDEQLDAKEQADGIELLNRHNWKCDLVLSHTCPCIYEPTDLFLSVVDQSMVDKTMERYLGSIEYQLDYRAWCWGHYHQFRDYPRPDGRFRTMLFNDYAINLDDYMSGEINKL